MLYLKDNKITQVMIPQLVFKWL